MINRLFIIMVVVFACAGSALGQGATGNSQDSNNSGNSGGANSDRDGSSPGNSWDARDTGGGQSESDNNQDQTSNSSSEQSTGIGSANANGAEERPGSGQSRSAVSLTPDQARDAVSHQQAMPLASLAEMIRLRGDGEVIDADLMLIEGRLIYAIKVLDQRNRLSVHYYDADSADFIGSR